jgi:hypothetical protein
MLDDLKLDTLIFVGDNNSYLYWWLITATFDLYLDYICFAYCFSLKGIKSTESFIFAVLS